MTKTEVNPMHLKTREPSHLCRAPRCLAWTRRGTPCQSPAVAGKTRCRNACPRGGQWSTEGEAQREISSRRLHYRGDR